ncbi:MAG: dockerin type I repeat-containing protein, partial [Clostridia bacterium]|nr:dockerin type I repeat-containing protein [Clostridia bacterium]
HSAGDWEHVNDATCTENGANVKKCTVCGQVLETEILPADGHIASDWKTVEEATADKNGLKAKTCTVCGETLATAITSKHTAILPNENGKPEAITDRWGKGNATEENITLIANPSDLLGMDVVLFQTFEELCKIDSISLSLYHSAGDGIGYPDSTATVLLSTDGINYSPVGTFTLQTAELSLDQAGTVTSTLTFETEAEALSVKILLHAGESTDLVGPTPDGGESYWKYIGIVSLDVSQVSDDVWVKGDVDGDGSFNTIDYMKLKRYILGTFELDEAAYKRADIDLDGSVAALDYMMLKRIYLGTHSFPA